MTERPKIAAARIEVERSRARVMATAHELQERLSPKTLARDAWEGAKEKGADLAEDAVDAVRARPLAAGGVVAAITMFLAREPLMDLAGKLVGGVGDKRKDPQDPQGAKPNRTIRRNAMIDQDDAASPTTAGTATTAPANARSKPMTAPATARPTRSARRRCSRLPAELPPAR